MAILRIKDAEGNIQEILAIKGENGKDGADGKDYVLTEEDIEEIARRLGEQLSTETWTFTLEDGSTVNKVVAVG